MSDDGKRDEKSEFKVFVGGLSWQMKESDLKDAFSKYDPLSASIIADKHTQRPRGFGFVWLKDKLGMEDAIRDMHDKELDGRKISCVRAVPMDQTKPGTPAAVLGGGQGARSRDYAGGRYPNRDSREYGRGGGYDRGYDRYAPAAGGYERPGERGSYGGGGGGYDPRGYPGYERGYDSRSYGGGYGSAAPAYARDPYARDPYSAYAGAGGYAGYERAYEGGAYDSRYPPAAHDDRGAGGPDRRSYGAGAPRSGPYDRPPERRPDGRR